MQGIFPDMLCTFTSDAEDHADIEFSGVSPGPGLGMDEDLSTEIIETTATHDVLKLWPWVNQACVLALLYHRALR